MCYLLASFGYLILKVYCPLVYPFTSCVPVKLPVFTLTIPPGPAHTHATQQSLSDTWESSAAVCLKGMECLTVYAICTFYTSNDDACELHFIEQLSEVAYIVLPVILQCMFDLPVTVGDVP